MKKIGLEKFIILTIESINIMIFLMLSFFNNDKIWTISSLIFCAITSIVIIIFLYKLILYFSFKNHSFSKIKNYILILLFLLMDVLMKLGYNLSLSFCNWSCSLNIKWKLLISIIIICFIALFFKIIFISHKNNKKVKEQDLNGNEFNNLFNNNINLKDILDNYYENKNLDGAILVNGPWGSGKTFFIEKYINLFNTRNKNKNERAVYVSLNGLKNIDEVNNALFASLHPILSSINNSPILKVLNCATKYTTDILSIDYDSLSEINFDISSYNATLIVFDDLERCQIEIPILFGYIDFIKKSCNKIILIADERELINYLFPMEEFHNKSVSSNVLIATSSNLKESKNDNNYDLFNQKKEKNKYDDIVKELLDIEKTIYPKKYYEIIKEKVVWKTIDFSFDISILFNEKNIKNYPNIKQIIINNEYLIKQIEGITKCSNLRTYKCSLAYFNDLYQKLHLENYKNKEDLEKIVLVNIFILMISYKHPLKFSAGKEIRIDKKDYKILNSFSNFYNDLYADMDELKKELRILDKELTDIETKKIPDYILFLNETWVFSNDDEITKNIQKMLDDYKSNNLETRFFLSCYNFLYTYKEEFKFELDDIDLSDVKNNLIERTLNSKEKVELEDFYFLQHNYYEKEIESIKEIYNALQLMNQRLDKNEIIEGTLNLSNLSLDKIKKISEMAIGRKAFLSLFNIDDLKNYIIQSNNEEIHDFRKLVHQVYGFSNISDYFESDKIIIKELIDFLISYKDKCESKTKRKLLEWFIGNLNEILNRL